MYRRNLGIALTTVAVFALAVATASAERMGASSAAKPVGGGLPAGAMAMPSSATPTLPTGSAAAAVSARAKAAPNSAADAAHPGCMTAGGKMAARLSSTQGAPSPVSASPSSANSLLRAHASANSKLGAPTGC